jgi:hypothetical protein
VAIFDPEVSMHVWISRQKGSVLFQVRRGYKVLWAHTEPYHADAFRAHLSQHVAQQIKEAQLAMGIKDPIEVKAKTKLVSVKQTGPVSAIVTVEVLKADVPKRTLPKKTLPKKGGDAQ